MGPSRGLLFCVFSPAFIMPIINFAVGLNRQDDACPVYKDIATNLIGSGVSEFCLLIFFTYFFNRLASGYDKVDVFTTTTTYADGSKKVETSKMSHLKWFAGLTFLSFVATCYFFIVSHNTFRVYHRMQYKDSNQDNYCSKTLYQTAFALLIVTYVMLFFTLLFILVLWCKKK
ncbi:unnamed protein product [Didymodactylos carnosus]|uniref:Uncharacterized protein n=1 Tax=Didymodactylos carnosus TaxID=1234261 RepID=A0A815Y8Y0_9BILA|nr:unnamed protein product [Didymodactylos carnosus]CAF1567089.1 unnamed protein product [Didymodactylos carnosus]CAF3851434.1 unnamed protein product [Didymodactylos carnosus]CAF4429459.1 unnamed protein product [Didymodactylos carnosus]